MADPFPQDMEPDFIMQAAELTTWVERSDWFLKGMRDMKKDDVTFVRCSLHPDQSHICLLEGWLIKPKDQGEPRFQMTTALDDALGSNGHG